MSKEKKVQSALEEFNKMLPMLNGFARSFSGNSSVRVIAHQATQTDGKTIMIRPPLSLADKQPHRRVLCEHRDELYQQRCGKCGTREAVMSYLYHEMAHIMFGSLDEQHLESVKYVTINTLEQCDDKEFADYAVQRVVNRKHFQRNASSQSWAYCVSPYLGFIHQALEDYRIDTASFTVRAGIKLMRFAATEKILNEGVENDGDENIMWIDRKLNIQMAVAMLCYLHGHLLEDRFTDEILEALEDEKLTIILNQMSTATHALDTYACSIQVLVRLRELGFFIAEDEPDPKQDEQESNEDGESDPNFGGPEGGGQEEEVESDDQGDDTDDQGEGDVDESTDYGTPEEVEEAVGVITGHEKGEELAEEDVTPEVLEELKKAINQMTYFDTSSGIITEVRLFKGPDGPAFDDKSNFGRKGGLYADLNISEAVVGKSVLEARRAFTDNQQSHMLRHKKSGRVNGAALGKRAWNQDERLFQKKLVPGRKDYEVLIGLDVSGSTTGDEIVQIKRSAAALADVCARSGVAFSIWAHSGEICNSDGSVGWDFNKTSVGFTLDLFCIKAVEEPWDKRKKNVLQRVTSCAGNLDGHTMEFYRKQLDKSRATDKVLMYFTDGLMPASNYNEELKILQREIKTCKQRGYTLLGVGIGTDSPKAHGLDTVQVDSDADIFKVVRHLTKELTK